MCKINVYQMNLNPYMTDKPKEKSVKIRSVFNAYKRSYNRKAVLGDVQMQSFKPLDNQGYGRYIDYCMENINEPTVVVFSNLFDLGIRANSAYSRLVYASSNENILGIYFTDYSLEKNFKIDIEKITSRTWKDSDWEDDELGKIFRENPGKTPRVKRSVVSDEVAKAIKDIREEDSPALLSDIAEVLDMTPSMVRRIAAYSKTPYSTGKPITHEQRKHLIEAYKSARADEFSRFIIKKEKYIP